MAPQASVSYLVMLNLNGAASGEGLAHKGFLKSP